MVCEKWYILKKVSFIVDCVIIVIIIIIYVLYTMIMQEKRQRMKEINDNQEGLKTWKRYIWECNKEAIQVVGS